MTRMEMRMDMACSTCGTSPVYQRGPDEFECPRCAGWADEPNLPPIPPGPDWWWNEERGVWLPHPRLPFPDTQGGNDAMTRPTPVYSTHLTLPTICSV